MLVLEGLIGLQRTIQLQLLQHYWLGTGLDYCDIEWFALEMNRDHSVIFEIASKYCILDSSVACEGYFISSNGFLPSIVDIRSSELNLPSPIHFSSLIPRMLMFNLTISCLTTSNSP